MSLIKYSVLEYLPKNLIKELSKKEYKMLNEIRIRKNCPILVVVDGNRRIINIKLTESDIENIIYKVCDGSIHSYDDQIVNGYVTDNCGIRIGLCGELVVKNGKVLAVRKITSLCLRIPNVISGVSKEFYDKIYNGGSVLVISPPGVGKTSFIRDFINNLCKNTLANVVVIDERNEILIKTSKDNQYLNTKADVLTYASKDYGFNQALRTLNPDVIVTDEITTLSEVKSIINTIFGGVSVVATVHGSSLEGVFSRSYMGDIQNEKVFDYVVLITLKNKDRIYQYYDKDFNLICL